jgi:hypothetical protein
MTMGVEMMDDEAERGYRWTTLENMDGEKVRDRLISGDIHTLGSGGVCLKNSGEGVEVEHCEAHLCVNALDGDEHPYDHDDPVGCPLRL